MALVGGVAPRRRRTIQPRSDITAEAAPAKATNAGMNRNPMSWLSQYPRALSSSIANAVAPMRPNSLGVGAGRVPRSGEVSGSSSSVSFIQGTASKVRMDIGADAARL